MTEEERQELKKQVSELRGAVIPYMEAMIKRESRLANTLKRIEALTSLENSGIGKRINLEALSVLEELYPLKKVNDHV